jgi:phage shock protein PspC (stress-responsive transcriptional regulator)
LKRISILLGIIGALVLVFGITLFFTGHEFLGIISAIIAVIIFPSRRNKTQQPSWGNDGHNSYYSNDYDYKNDNKKENESTNDAGDSGDSGDSD